MKLDKLFLFSYRDEWGLIGLIKLLNGMII